MPFLAADSWLDKQRRRLRTGGEQLDMTCLTAEAWWASLATQQCMSLWVNSAPCSAPITVTERFAAIKQGGLAIHTFTRGQDALLRCPLYLGLRWRRACWRWGGCWPSLSLSWIPSTIEGPWTWSWASRSTHERASGCVSSAGRSRALRQPESEKALPPQLSWLGSLAGLSTGNSAVQAMCMHQV
jgi:hypothetical protein